MNLRDALFVCFFLVANARAADTDLLHRALGCQLRDNELALLVTALAKQRSDFKKPAQQYGAPSADVYDLGSPLSIYGYTSSQVVVTPTRILIAVPGKTVGDAVTSLKLEEAKFSPASRAVRSTVSTIAMKRVTRERRGQAACRMRVREFGRRAVAEWRHELSVANSD